MMAVDVREATTPRPRVRAAEQSQNFHAPTAAVEVVWREHGERLWRSLFAWTGGQRELADDAVAESFARLIEHWGEVREPVGWVYRTAFRFVLAELRRDHRMPVTPQIREQLGDEGLVGVLESLRKLSRSQRSAIVLRYEADLPINEIARVMGTTTAAVKVHLFRGRRRLRELLGSEDVDDA